MTTISKERIPVEMNRRLALIIHIALKFIFLFISLFNLGLFRNHQRIQDIKIERVIVLRTDGLGDVVLSTPAFRAVREAFPRARVTLLAGSHAKELVETMPLFDEIMYFDAPWMIKNGRRNLGKIVRGIMKIKKGGYDLGIDLRGDFRNNILMYLSRIPNRMGFNITGCDFLLTHVIPAGRNHHIINTGKSLIKYLRTEKIDAKFLSVWITEEDREFSERLFAEHSIRNEDLAVVIHPGSKWEGRHWSTRGFAQIGDRLIKVYRAIVILAEVPGEEELTREIMKLMDNLPILAKKTSLREFCGLLGRSDLFIGLDSAPMHLATAMGTRVVALMGPARREAVGPYGSRHVIVTRQDDFSCSPCSQTVCERPEESCMKAISVDDVWQAIVAQLEKIAEEKYCRTRRVSA